MANKLDEKSPVMQSMATIKLNEGEELVNEKERSFSGPPKFPEIRNSDKKNR